MKFSIIQNNRQVVGEITLAEYVSKIKQPSSQVIEYRELLESKPTLAGLKKRSMPAITPAGTFKERRSNETLIEYSGIVCLDIDHKHNPDIDLNRIKAEISKDRYELLVHSSLSGTGLAVFMKVDTGAEMHPSAYAQTSEYIQKKYGIKLDQTCKDISRQRYMSYDSNCFYNPNANTFHVIDPVIYEAILEEVDFTTNIRSFEEGERNSSVYQLAINCSKNGIDPADLQIFCEQWFAEKDFDSNEIKRTIGSGYKKANESEEGYDTIAPQAASAKVQNCNSAIGPPLPPNVFKNLPNFFYGFDTLFSTDHERDILFIGVLVMFSSIFPCFGYYFGHKVFANFYVLIYAPPANSKGRVTIVRKLVGEVDKHLKSLCENEWAKYKIQCEECKRTKDCNPETKKPECRGLFMPANSSNAALIKLLKMGTPDVAIPALVIDSEADVWSQTRDNTWSELDASYRSAFHHETISSNRIESGVSELDEPRISLLLTGTPNQAMRLAESLENGLVSRLTVYSFKAPHKWLDPFGESNELIPKFTEAKSNEVLNLFSYNNAHPFEFKFSKEQQKSHFAKYSDLHDNTSEFDPFTDSIRRQGLVVFRIAMILSAIERVELGLKDPIHICSDRAFEAAMIIISVLEVHNRNLYKLLGNKSHQVTKSVDTIYGLTEVLPESFTTKEFIQIAIKVKGIQERRSLGILGEMITKGLITKLKHGHYSKVA